MKKHLSKNVNLREQILFGEEKYNPSEYEDGIRAFEKVPYDVLDQLVAANLIDLDDRQNNSPTAGELIAYGKSHRNVTFDGYAVERDRYDHRVTITTVRQNFDESNPEDAAEFSEKFCNADTLKVTENNGYAWWD